LRNVTALALSLVLPGCISLSLSCVPSARSSLEVPPVREASPISSLPGGLVTPTPPLTTTRVIPGQSLGEVSLGDTFEHVISAVPFRKEYDELHAENVITMSGGVSVTCAKLLHKNPFPDGMDLFVYFKNERVVQIEGDSPNLYFDKLQGGVSISDAAKALRNAKASILRGSGGTVVGGKNLVYLFKEQTGLALEFQYSPNTKERVLSKFIIFPPNEPFRPATCVAPPQSLEPATLASIMKNE
jgi:hypothetical protein